MTFPVPRPRRPQETAALTPGRPGAREERDSAARLRSWYVDGLGWGDLFVTRPSSAPLLRTGLRFDVLELPADAGLALLARLGPRAPGVPAALGGGVLRLLVAAGGAQELPGLLDWLQWGALVPELTARGAGGHIEAPLPPGGSGSQGAAVWLRPPELGGDVATALPGPVAVGGDQGAPSLSLVRLVDAAATCCLRVRMRGVTAQPLAFS